jgi:putative sigma-54 modulation protein
MTLDKLEKQIKKNKEKVREHRSGKGKSKGVLLDEAVAAEEDTEKQVIIRNIDFKPMDTEEAVMQMELANNNFMVFTNARSGLVNVIYRRKDGHYGLIQPSP